MNDPASPKSEHSHQSLPGLTLDNEAQQLDNQLVGIKSLQSVTDKSAQNPFKGSDMSDEDEGSLEQLPV